MTTSLVEEVSPFRLAVVDAVMTLSRCRIRANGPFYIPRPRSVLFIRIIERSADSLKYKVLISCDSWEGTEVTLELSNSNKVNDWLAWGDVTILYGDHPHHVGLRGQIIRKSIYPSFATSVSGLPMRYRIRTRVMR